MKRTHLLAVLVSLSVIAIFATDASAYYHPTVGRFVSRDPGPGGDSTAPVTGSRFIPRDPTGTGQYADGMNLYQYARSNPLAYADPDGRIVIAISGLGEDTSKVSPLANEIKRIIDGALPGDAKVEVKLLGGGCQGPENELKDLYRQFVTRKKNECSLEQFVVVGHSDGATAIYRSMKKFNEEPEFTPAYIGFIDFVRLNYWNLLSVNISKNGSATISKPRNTYTIHNFRQITGKPLGWKGRYIYGADLNLIVPDHSHYEILQNEEIHTFMGIYASLAYSHRMRLDRKRHPEWSADKTKQW